MLTIVDSCTRWPWVYLLKSLSAQVVCEAVLNMFFQVGISSVIISDNGTNFMSQLTLLIVHTYSRPTLPTEKR